MSVDFKEGVIIAVGLVVAFVIISTMMCMMVSVNHHHEMEKACIQQGKLYELDKGCR